MFNPRNDASILIVEDEIFIALLLQHELECLGHATVDVSTTISSALRRLDSCAPDLAILDYHLGYETSEAIAMRLNARSIPYILCTSQRDSALSPTPFQPVGILAKPINVSALGEMVQSALRAVWDAADMSADVSAA